MKNRQLLAFCCFLSFVLTGCFGDKETIIGQELGDTNFVNKNFAGNKKEFAALPKNMCAFISEKKINELYPDAAKILFDDGQTFMTKSCRFLVYIGEGDYNYLSGVITAVEDKPVEGQDWKEQWELKKKLSKSSEYIPDLGKAAVWIGKQRELSIKMDGYIITILVPGSPFNKEELAKKRNYKNIGVAIAKSTGLF